MMYGNLDLIYHPVPMLRRGNVDVIRHTTQECGSQLSNKFSHKKAPAFSCGGFFIPVIFI